MVFNYGGCHAPDLLASKHACSLSTQDLVARYRPRISHDLHAHCEHTKRGKWRQGTIFVCRAHSDTNGARAQEWVPLHLALRDVINDAMWWTTEANKIRSYS